MIATISDYTKGLLAVAIILAASGIDASEKLKVTAGVGYDFLSQEFFLDSASLVGADSVIVNLELKNEYLDDVKGMLSAVYLPYVDRRIELRTSYEQTSDYFRIRFIEDARLKIGSNRLSISNEFELKNRYRDSSTFADSYLTGYSRARFTTPLSASISNYYQVKADFISFDSISEFSYNYQRFEGKLGLSKSFENFSFADFNLFVQNRQVPDSLPLNYLDIGGEATAFLYYSSGELDLYARLESKDYNLAENREDHYRFETILRNKLRFDNNLYTRQEIEFEFTQYDPSAPVDYSYARTGMTLLFGYSSGFFSLGIGPDFENLSEVQEDVENGEDYFESALRTEFDYMNAGSFFISIESELGRRDLKFDNDYQSDFKYERLSAIADIKLYGSLNLNGIFSAEWEWHDNEADNSRLFLLSSNLTYEL